MKTLLALMLLIPSLSISGELIKAMNNFYLKINSESVYSSQIVFHAKQVSDSSNYLKIASDRCYKALLKNNNQAIYTSNVDCLLVSSAYGNTKSQIEDFNYKLQAINIFIYNFYYANNKGEHQKDINTISNYWSNFSENLILANEVIDYRKKGE